jgi:hypothetical protein
MHARKRPHSAAEQYRELLVASRKTLGWCGGRTRTAQLLSCSNDGCGPTMASPRGQRNLGLPVHGARARGLISCDRAGATPCRQCTRTRSGVHIPWNGERQHRATSGHTYHSERPAMCGGQTARSQTRHLCEASLDRGKVGSDRMLRRAEAMGTSRAGGGVWCLAVWSGRGARRGLRGTDARLALRRPPSPRIPKERERGGSRARSPVVGGGGRGVRPPSFRRGRSRRS